MNTDYESMTTEELHAEYDTLVEATAFNAARGHSFTMDAMVAAGDIKRELKARGEN